MARTLNLGILAHVDAGKTSLTERLLYSAGVIDEIGSVDAGSTRTDTLELERRRGITIRSAVVSFTVGDVVVNLIDTPGHPDFIAEVERVLGVLDGAVLVVSAVEGVQAQTRVLWRTLHRLGIPTLIFVNKIDRTGARDTGVLAEIAERLTAHLVPLSTVHRAGTRDARVTPRAIPVEALAEHDDGLLAAYVDGAGVPQHRLRDVLRDRTARARTHPVLFGSAITGAGVDDLRVAVADLLPAAAGDPAAPLRGTVFKVERGPAGEKVAYVRLFDGTLRVRDRLGDDRVTAVAVFGDGALRPGPQVTAGRIATVRGLAGARVGDPLGPAAGGHRRQFAPPSLETVVLPRRRADAGRLHAALTQLAEQDPLIALRQDDLRHEVSVSLYGEVQKEVLQATLAEEYGLAVRFRETTTICVERVTGTGEAAEIIGVAPNPFLATVGLRVAPAPPGTGLRFTLGVELGAMPSAFFTAVEETVPRVLREGLHGWQVADCTVTMTRSGYWARQSHAHGTFDKSMSSTAGDFRHLTPLVLMDALRRAGTRVHEPIHAVRLEVPAAALPAVLPVLARLRGVPLATTVHGSVCVVEGEVPAARVHDLQQRLPALTRGEGVLESAFDRYAPVSGPAPSRPRTDHNPLDRKEYLLRVVRRTGSAPRPG
ncbi:GTP-binding protein [Jidongwangia harbinensis]|uniref:GTP-binding protein n=1 Tax=Jidongwangia harbinensis TaxID=2878561 RepID=UPI001CD9C16E|nr:TetM/TetW/TetO/TetS family tetracycline resistance ribosomal protection protein [Jidongwangia harbinensis]MCA2214968.1 TetM/TetW/TetO/TetS family tetracycline resistance ribosomal protection protein [Jidongwangia harbinensis]